MTKSLENLVGIGRATVIDDTGDVQLIQVTEGAAGDGGHDLVTDKVARVAEFGFASVPPLNSVIAVIRRGGDRARSLIFGTSHTPSRLKNLKPGDTGIYDVRGAKITLTEDGLLIDCAGLAAKVKNFSSLRVEGDLHVTGDVLTRADGTPVSVNALRDAFHNHHHSGVQTGSGVSGLTDHDA